MESYILMGGTWFYYANLVHYEDWDWNIGKHYTSGLRIIKLN